MGRNYFILIFLQSHRCQSESCEIYVKPHVAFNLIDVALKGHSGMPPAAGRCPRAAQLQNRYYVCIGR